MSANNKKSEPIVPPSIGPYTFKGGIGHGAFSVVKIVHNEELNQNFACKIIAKEWLSTKKRCERFESEIRIQQQLNHPNIVKIYDLLSDETNYYIILEYCPGGELFKLIVQKKRLLEVQAKPIIYQVLDALEYIHKLGVCHRDIKPENILLDENECVKLSDFGLSKFISQGSSLVSTPCGSPCYASPECLSGEDYDGVASDMWSTGVLLYATVCGQLPWTNPNHSELFRQIKAAEFTIPNFVTNECRDLIFKLMTRDSTKRITAADAKNHEWFKDMQNITHTVTNPSKKEDLSIRKVDEFFQKYDESDPQVDKIAITFSDSTFSSIPQILHKLTLPDMNDNIPEEKTDIKSSNTEKIDQNQPIQHLITQIDSTQHTVRIQRPPNPVDILPKMRKTQSRINRAKILKLAKPKIRNASSTKKIPNLEHSHLPTIVRRSYARKSKASQLSN